MRRHGLLGLAAIAALAAACGGRGGPEPKMQQGTKSVGGKQVVAEAARKFDSALEDMAEHDRKADWTDADCTAVAQSFLDAVGEQKSAGKSLPEAHYNAGLAYQRCGKHEEAKAQFREALTAAPGFHQSKVQLALYEYRQKGDAATDETIQSLHEAVIEAKFQNLDALVNLAMLQMKRNGPQGSAGCSNDMDCAKLNIQRALAIDDGYMPAFNQLALYYLNLARAKSEERGKSRARRRLMAARAEKAQLSGQMLDLATLVCSQAIRKNPKYAPIHNTLGLIQVEQKNINNAVGAFDRARGLDPNFFEAQMNFAAVNLSFRGFDKAEQAYRQAVKLRPDSYEAHLGLALAIRGQIDDSNLDKNMAEARSILEKCKKLAPDRAETYFNDAILTMEFQAKYADGEQKQIQHFAEATTQFNTFIQKAGASAEYEDAVKNAQERIKDIEKIVEFIRAGQRAEAEAKKASATKPK